MDDISRSVITGPRGYAYHNLFIVQWLSLRSHNLCERTNTNMYITMYASSRVLGLIIAYGYNIIRYVCLRLLLPLGNTTSK